VKRIQVERAAISLAISSFVFPSVIIPSDFAATINGSAVGAVLDADVGIEGAV